MAYKKSLLHIKDHLWKGGLDHFFEAAVHYFYDTYAHEFDFTEPIVALDSELNKLYPDNTAQGRVADKLCQAKTVHGHFQWVLFHTEVQGQPDKEFDKRMFQMYYRIFDRFDQQVVSLAILTDEYEHFRPGNYQLHRMGTRLQFEYNTFKLKDYQPHELLKGNNPFGFMLMVAWYHLYGGNSDEAKYKNKMAILRQLFAAGLDKADTRRLFHFVLHYTVFDDSTFLSKLELNIKTEFHNEMEAMTIEEAVNWYLTEKGREEGKEETTIANARNAIALGLDNETIAQITQLPEATVEQLRTGVQ